MVPWFRERLEILLLSLKRPVWPLLVLCAQMAVLVLRETPYRDSLPPIPMDLWAWAWGLALFLGVLDLAAERQEGFDETSRNFFKAYLDYLIQDGHRLFRQPDDPDLYRKASEWQRRAILGIAIGQGPERSEEFAQKMEAEAPLREAYRIAQEGGGNEALGRAIQGHLRELDGIRSALPELPGEDEGDIRDLEQVGPEAVPPSRAQLPASKVKRGR